MPQKPVNKDSARLMRMSAKLRKTTINIMMVLVTVLVVAGLFYLFQDPFTGIVLLICGAMGAGGIFVLREKDLMP